MGPWALILACSGEEPAWKEALEADPQQALEACRALEGTAADECAYGVLRSNRMVTAENCLLLDEGPYRNECVFTIAEILAEQGQHGQAAEKCREAGERFERSCYQHGWFRASMQALRAADETGPSESSLAILDAAVEAYGQDLVDPEQVLHDAFWWAWWEDRTDQPIDLSICQEAPRCTAGTLTAASRYAWAAGCAGDATARCAGDATCLEAMAAGKQLACDHKERPGSPIFKRKQPGDRPRSGG